MNGVRCKETASIAFNKFETKNFLNSFFSSKFATNRETQMKELKNLLKIGMVKKI